MYQSDLGHDNPPPPHQTTWQDLCRRYPQLEQLEREACAADADDWHAYEKLKRQLGAIIAESKRDYDAAYRYLLACWERAG